MQKQKIIIIVLGVLLVLTAGYIGLGKYSAWKEQGQIEVFQQGAQYGYEQAVVQIAEMAVSCEQVPLRVENQTINMIAVDCLNPPASQPSN